MAGIPEDQLNTWAAIGAQTTSKDTYATIKHALESADAGYVGKQKKIFLQGSYGNDTNIRKESDVDVVIRLDALFSYDISALPVWQKDAFKAAHTASTYTYADYKDEVLGVLYERFEDHLELGTKAVTIKPFHNRRKADVLIAIQHKKYSNYTGTDEDDPVVGISFNKSDGTRVVNFPRQHSLNLTAKNKATNGWLKHLVRIFKNARQKLIEDGVIKAGVAPSYYLEGLLYNVPDDRFGGTYRDSMVNCINWLWDADRSNFWCANEQYELLDGNANVTWNTKNCNAYLDGLVDLWKYW